MKSRNNPLQNYRGNKGFQHAYMEIINLIPPHKNYYELFAGSAGIFRNIFTSELSILNDLDLKVINELKKTLSAAGIVFYNCNALELIKSIPGHKDNFVYLDPPYPKTSRRSATDIYNFEMSDCDHVQLLQTIKNVKFNCMISTYENKLYSKHLKKWNLHTFKTSVHGKLAVEYLYFNYDKPTELHDYRYLGSDCWDRQRIKRKAKRILQKLSTLPAVERNYLLQEINIFFKTAGKDKNNCPVQTDKNNYSGHGIKK